MHPSQFIPKEISDNIRSRSAQAEALGQLHPAQLDIIYKQSWFNLFVPTKREIEVIELIAKGYSSREIADRLKVGLKTIEIHRYHILKKLKLKNVAALVNYFFTNAAVIFR